MAKFLSANVVAQKPGFQEQWLPYPPKGEVFLERKKTNFERIAHLNTEFDSAKEAHFKTGKTEKKKRLYRFNIQANLILLLILSQLRSFPAPKSPCVLMRPHQFALSNKQNKD